MGLRGIDELIFPAVVAHRGASIDHSENTLPAFEAAVAAGADAVEFDVRVTVDGRAVVMHDADVSHTTDGTGLVHELTFAQVRGLTATRGADAGARVPSLEETLATLSGRAGVDVEIKPHASGDAEGVRRCVDEVVRLLDELPFDGPVLITSFSDDALTCVRNLRSDLATGLLVAGPVDTDVMRIARHAGHRAVLPHVVALESAGERFVRRAHDMGLLVATWTVDDPQRIERLFRWGVDAVVTNDPATVVPIRDAAGPAGRAP